MIFLQHIIFYCLKPIYNFLRALGVFPLSRNNESGEFYFDIRSPSMAYSLLVFVVLTVNMQLRLINLLSSYQRQNVFFQIYCGFILIDRMNKLHNLEGKFVEAVIGYLFIVNLLPIIIVPLMWYEAVKIASLLNSWADFEVRRRTVMKSLLYLEYTRCKLIIFRQSMIKLLGARCKST